MKSRAFTLIIAVAGVALLSFSGASSSAQYAPSGSILSPQAAALIQELKEQNTALVAQQAKLEEQLEQVSESVRQARIWAARSGGKGAAK